MKNGAHKTTADRTLKRKSVFREYAESIVLALVFAFFIRTFIVQSFNIPSGSMENTLEVGDYIMVNKFVYGTKLPFLNGRILKIRNPGRGDIIVFRCPEVQDKDLIKRVIGAPGDRIQIVNKQVFINGRPYLNPEEIHKDNHIIPGEQSPRDNTAMIKVPEGSYFVMGDNRDNSYDSRFWGFVREGDIKGLAFIKYWSWDNELSRVRWGNIFTPVR